MPVKNNGGIMQRHKMFRKAVLVIVSIFFISGCAGEIGELHKKDVKEAIPVSRQKDSFDPYCSVRSDGKIQTCLEAYAPVLFISASHGDSTKLDYEPKEIYSMLNESDLHGPEAPDRKSDKVYDFKEVTISSLDIKSLLYNIFSSDRFDLNLREADPGFLFYLVPDPLRFNEHYKTMVYGREAIYETESEDFTPSVKYRILQYFFFYPYNNWLNKHEGDWEMIQVILDETTKTPLKITYSWHYGGSTFDWSDSSIEKIAETHPAVYVASGSHASYWSRGDHTFSQFGLPCFFTDHALPVKTLIPAGLGIKTSDIQEDLRDLPQAFYTLSSNIEQVPWTRWKGYWGEAEAFSLPGSSGPQGPYHQKVDNRYSKWKNPIAYTNNPISSHYNLCARSPVKLHVYDSEGNSIGRTEEGDLEVNIPGLYLYSPDDKQIVILTSEDLVLKIKATDKGEFDFGFTRYQNEISTMTDVSYYDVQITDKTVATVHVTKANPEFTMEIDLDGDGTIDLLKTPNPEDVIVKKIPVGNLDENVTQAPFPVEEDRDGDAIFDSIDNCIDNFNPDQKDLDNNGLGDACDDFDRDGVSDYMDNCPRIPGSQLDTDRDGIGNVCDKCPNDIMNDSDKDGFCQSEGDCNDSNPGVNPGAAEVCNRIDDNCNVSIDEGFVIDKDGKCIDAREDITRKSVQTQETLCPSGYELWNAKCLIKCAPEQIRDASGNCVTKEPEITSLSIFPPVKTLKVGETVNFTASAKFDDGSTRNVTGEAAWFPGASFTATSSGVFTIVTSYQGKVGKARVTVKPKDSGEGYTPWEDPNLRDRGKPPVDIAQVDQLGDGFQGEMPSSEPPEQSGAAGGGEPIEQGDYGKPPARETGECEPTCPTGETCVNGECVPSGDTGQPPYGPPRDDGIGTGTDWVDWATSSQRPPERHEEPPPAHEPPSGRGGGVVQCNTIKEEGGDTPETHTVELGKTSGTFLFEYKTLTIKDRIVVRYEGSTKFDTGCVGTGGWKKESVTYSGSSTQVTVEVQPNCEGGTNTKWYFNANCP